MNADVAYSVWSRLILTCKEGSSEGDELGLLEGCQTIKKWRSVIGKIKSREAIDGNRKDIVPMKTAGLMERCLAERKEMK